LDVDEF